MLAFGVARDIIENSVVEMEFDELSTIRELKNELSNRYQGFEQLRHFNLAVNEEYREDDFKLSENDEVVIIPPVSGG